MPSPKQHFETEPTHPRSKSESPPPPLSFETRDQPISPKRDSQEPLPESSIAGLESLAAMPVGYRLPSLTDEDDLGKRPPSPPQPVTPTLAKKKAWDKQVAPSYKKEKVASPPPDLALVMPRVNEDGSIGRVPLDVSQYLGKLLADTDGFLAAMVRNIEDLRELGMLMERAARKAERKANVQSEEKPQSEGCQEMQDQEVQTPQGQAQGGQIQEGVRFEEPEQGSGHQKPPLDNSKQKATGPQAMAAQNAQSWDKSEQQSNKGKGRGTRAEVSESLLEAVLGECVRRARQNGVTIAELKESLEFNKPSNKPKPQGRQLDEGEKDKTVEDALARQLAEAVQKEEAFQRQLLEAIEASRKMAQQRQQEQNNPFLAAVDDMLETTYEGDNPKSPASNLSGDITKPQSTCKTQPAGEAQLEGCLSCNAPLPICCAQCGTMLSRPGQKFQGSQNCQDPPKPRSLTLGQVSPSKGCCKPTVENNRDWYNAPSWYNDNPKSWPGYKSPKEKEFKTLPRARREPSKQGSPKSSAGSGSTIFGALISECLRTYPDSDGTCSSSGSGSSSDNEVPSKYLPGPHSDSEPEPRDPGVPETQTGGELDTDGPLDAKKFEAEIIELFGTHATEILESHLTARLESQMAELLEVLETQATDVLDVLETQVTDVCETQTTKTPKAQTTEVLGTQTTETTETQTTEVFETQYSEPPETQTPKPDQTTPLLANYHVFKTFGTFPRRRLAPQFPGMQRLYLNKETKTLKTPETQISEIPEASKTQTLQTP